jgi:hypothetical protein
VCRRLAIKIVTCFVTSISLQYKPSEEQVLTDFPRVFFYIFECVQARAADGSQIFQRLYVDVNLLDGSCKASLFTGTVLQVFLSAVFFKQTNSLGPNRQA